MEVVDKELSLHFLKGGGEMANQIRNFDWALTQIGALSLWPQSLRSTVAVLLRSPLPMLLWWGPDSVQLYNDAFRKVLDFYSIEPNALGQPAAACWPAKIWTSIEIQVAAAFAGEAFAWSEGGLFSNSTDNTHEAIAGTFHFTAVPGEDGATAGILLTGTGSINTKFLEKTSEHLQTLFEEAPVATCVFKGRNLIIDLANEPMLRYWGKDRSVIGKPLHEALPELEGQPFLAILDDVYTTGKTHQAQNAPAELIINGVRNTYYFDYTYKAIYNADGTIYGVMDMALDVTEQVLSRQQLNKSQQKLSALFEKAPVGIATISADDALVLESANPFYGMMVGRQPSEIVGKPLLTALPELKDQGFDLELKKVIATGTPFTAEEVAVELVRDNKQETLYVNLTYQPQKNENDQVLDVFVIATDVTQQVLTRRRIEASERKMRSLINAVPAAISVFKGHNLIIESPNEIFYKFFNKGPEIEGQPLGPIMSGVLKNSEQIITLLQDVLQTGTPYESHGSEILFTSHSENKRFFDIFFIPLFNPNGEVDAVLDVSIEVTEQELANRKIEASESKLRSIIAAAPAGIGLFVGRDLIIETPNQTFIDIVGKGPGVEGLPLREAMPELLTEGQPFLKILDDVFTTGIPFLSPASLVKIVQDGALTDNYYNISYTPVFNAQKEVYAILDIAIDVTEQVKTQQALAAAEANLRGSIEMAHLGIWDVNIAAGTVTFSERLQSWFGYTTPVVSLEEAFRPVHENDKAAVLKTLYDALSPQSSGKYNAEYTVVNQQTGQEHILLAQAQTQFDASGKPYRMLGTAQDVTVHRRLQSELEQQVRQRTEALGAANDALQKMNEELAEANAAFIKTNQELLRSNQNLEEFAHAASHDLKEPIRKISFFTGQLRNQLSSQIAEGSTRTFERIEKATERMANLIDDLLLYSHVSQRPPDMALVDLNIKLERVLEDLELEIQQKKAVITLGNLPVVRGYPRQLQQLFQNLISNALKYSKADVPPLIQITATQIDEGKQQYHCIIIKDKGIGFEQEYSEKIFHMFTRLHGKAEYSGTGVGLSIVKKVVENHNGYVKAKSELGQGSTFEVWLPVS